MRRVSSRGGERASKLLEVDIVVGTALDELHIVRAEQVVLAAQVDHDAGVVAEVRRECGEPATPHLDELGRERKLVRRVHVEEVFRRHDDLTQTGPADFGVEHLKKGMGRVERCAVSALLSPVGRRGVLAKALADRLAADECVEPELADRVGPNAEARVIPHGVKDPPGPQRDPVVCQERLQRLRPGLVLADMDDEARIAAAHGFLPQAMIRGGTMTTRVATPVSPPMNTSRKACSLNR